MSDSSKNLATLYSFLAVPVTCPQVKERHKKYHSISCHISRLNSALINVINLQVKEGLSKSFKHVQTISVLKEPGRDRCTWPSRDAVQVKACVGSNRPEDTCDTHNLCRGPVLRSNKFCTLHVEGDYVNLHLGRTLDSLVVATLVCYSDK